METNPYLKDNEVVSNDNEVILEYEKPQLYKRVFSNIIDMILVFIVSVSLISLSLSIYNKSESYTNSNKIMNDVKIQSGFYKEIDDTLIFLTDELESATEKTYEEKYNTIKNITYTFFLDESGTFFEGNGIQIWHEIISKSDLFELVDGKYEKRDGVSDLRAYEFYKKFVDENILGYISKNINYIDAARTIIIVQIVIFLASFFLSIIIFYLIIPFIFYRGKKSIGRLIFKIAFVDFQGISASSARFLGKFALFFFIEVVLSIFTFGIPLFISISMLGFSKSGQCLSEYLSGVYAISSDNKKIYKNVEEYDETHIN